MKKNGNCKFLDSDIKDIRELYDSKVSIIEISRLYGINRVYISKIVHRKVRN